MSPKLSLKERLKLVKRVVEDKEDIAKVCREAKISRTLFYRWLSRFKKEKSIYSLVPRGNGSQEHFEKLSPRDRFSMIEEVKAGKNIVDVCKKYGTSRTLFYKWLDRYEKAPEGQKMEALWDKKPVVEKYFNQSPEEYEEAVLSAVIQYPELSSHKLVHVLPRVGNRPILSNHGVYNILRRHSLTDYNSRLLYSEANVHAPVVSGAIQSFKTSLSRILSLNPAFRTFIIRGGLTASLAIFTAIVIWGIAGFSGYISSAPSVVFSMGTIFALISLFVGMIFFLYSLKYYMTIAIVLSFSRKLEGGKASSLLYKAMRLGRQDASIVGPGLYPDVSKISLDQQPFISVHVALYNEKRVVERLLTALTSFEYENYEVIIADDSTDETYDLLLKWKDHPRVKISHRDTREGFKGAALKQALKITDPKAEFIAVFDADFIPYPDTLTQFLKYFKASAGSLNRSLYQKSKIAAVQGYQWHVLNKSENWVTRGVRSEYAGSYVMERSGIEIYGGLKQIAGSVYIVRRDALEAIGWGTSITEDFELTLKLYEKGYKVVYTPYVQAPAEAVSTIRRLIRQRMRWAEGHSFNIRRMAKVLLKSPKLSMAEKFEFTYLAPYYLQAAFFMLGTFAWFLAEVVFRTRLPFWTEVWGWSLILTNLLALPLMNLVALFLEEAEEKDYLGLGSFVALSYIVAPFQAYAAIRGFVSKEEGPWFRTPKTGRITDTFVPGHFYRFIKGVFGSRAGAENIPVSVSAGSSASAYNLNPYLAYATSSSIFDQFKIAKVKRSSRLFRSVLAIFLILTTNLMYLSKDVKIAYATAMTSPLKLARAAGEGTWPAWGNWLTNNSNGYGAGTLFRFRNRNANSGTNNYTWYTNKLPFGDGDAVIPAGQYFVQLTKSGGLPAANLINFGMQLLLTNNNGTSRAQLLWNTAQVNTSSTNNTVVQYSIGNLTGTNNIANSAPNRLAFRVLWLSASNGRANINWLINNSTAPSRLFLPGSLQVPEIPKPIMLIIIFFIIPVAPAIVSGRFRKPGRSVIEEFRLAWLDLIRKLTGLGEEELDKLPV